LDEHSHRIVLVKNIETKIMIIVYYKQVNPTCEKAGFLNNSIKIDHVNFNHILTGNRLYSYESIKILILNN
jgi:hypothetical protein